MDSKPVIFCDIDGVICDLMPAWLSRYNRDHDDTLELSQITAWDMTKFVKPSCGRAIYDYLHQHVLYDDAPPIEGALEGIEALRALGYRVVFATSTNLYMAGRKLRWLSENGFLKLLYGSMSYDYIEISDKALLSGSGIALIDDYQKNLDGFAGDRILFPAHHNANTPITNRQFRPNSWGEVVSYFESVKRRYDAVTNSCVANGLW